MRDSNKVKCILVLAKVERNQETGVKYVKNSQSHRSTQSLILNVTTFVIVLVFVCILLPPILYLFLCFLSLISLGKRTAL